MASKAAGNADDIRDFGDAAALAGWAPETQVAVLLRYVENQASDEAFLGFLRDALREEGALGEDGDEDEEGDDGGEGPLARCLADAAEACGLGPDAWREAEGPSSGCGVDWWFVAGPGDAPTHQLYINNDQASWSWSASREPDGEDVASGSFEEGEG